MAKQTKPQIKAVIYARAAAKPNEGETNPLALQVKTCMDFLEREHSISKNEVKVFQEYGSGNAINPELDKAIIFCEDKPNIYFVSQDSSRLSRSAEKFIGIYKSLSRCNVKLIFTSPSNYSTMDFVTSILEATDKFQKELFSQRIKETLRRREIKLKSLRTK